MIYTFKNLATGALFFSLIGLAPAFAASTATGSATTGKTSKKDGCTCTATMTADPTQKKESSESSVTKKACEKMCKDVKWQAQSAWQSTPGASWTYACTWGDENIDSGKKTSMKAVKKAVKK